MSNQIEAAPDQKENEPIERTAGVPPTEDVGKASTSGQVEGGALPQVEPTTAELRRVWEGNFRNENHHGRK